jgi:peptide/nickel transport system substrate-binding protein
MPAVALGALLCGCSPARVPANAPPAEETLRVALRGDPGTLDPTASTSLAVTAASPIFEPLIDLDPRLRPVPRLALSWTVEPGGRAWSFRLRPGVRWHGGGEMTAADVAGSLRRALEPTSRLFDLRESLAGAGEPAILSPLEIRIPFDPPAPVAEATWQSLRIHPDRPPRPSDPAWRPDGSGPYSLTAWRRGEWLLYSRHPGWWGGTPRFAHLLLRVFPDPGAAVRALRLGEVDIAPLRAADVAEARRGGAPFRPAQGEPMTAYMVVWNHRPTDSIFRDRRVRRAFTLAFDREGLATRVRRGLLRPSATHYPPLWQRGRPAPDPLPYDPAEAARLLDQAGWTDPDGDGWRERGGRRLSFPLLYALEDETRRDAALLLQANLRDVGAEVRLVRVDATALVRRLRARDFSAAVHALRLPPRPASRPLFHSSAAEDGFNHSGYADPALDRLLEDEERAPTPAALLEAGARIEQALRDQAPVLFIGLTVPWFGVSHRLGDFSPHPLGILVGWPGPASWSPAAAAGEPGNSAGRASPGAAPAGSGRDSPAPSVETGR